MTKELHNKPRRIIAAAAVAVLFGALTIYSGGSVTLFNGPARAAAGDYVPFVVWFNFIAGFAYVAAGTGLYLLRGWAVPLSVVIAVATMLVIAAFGIHIIQGGDYETRTVGALCLRILVWTAIAFAAYSAWPRAPATT